MIEIVVSFAAAALMALACTNIKINPLDRTGQVSGLAAIQIRFFVFAVLLFAGLLVAMRVRAGRHAELVGRITCAGLAGLASGFVAGGVIVALRGTPFALNPGAGDTDILVMWAKAMAKGGPPDELPPAFYPPLFPRVLYWYTSVTGQPAVYALKDLQIAFTAMAGPCAYLAWRLVLRPGWALAVGVVAALVVIDPYKPYGDLVLTIFVPILIRYFARLRESGDKHPYELVKTGVIYGVTLGILCLLYSGWFKWSIPAALILGVVWFPWRAYKRGATLVGATLLVFLLVNATYIAGMVRLQKNIAAAPAPTDGREPHMIYDDYIYFDTQVDPTYVAMWKGDLPGSTTEESWPPPGELGGIGLFTIICFAGTGVAVALGRRRTDVTVMLALLATIWFWRFWTAHYMYQTKLVQLWPRTTLGIIYLLVLFAGYGIHLVAERFRERSEETSPLRSPNALVGAVVALTFLFGSMGSSISDRYMPYNSLPRTTGWLSFLAHDAWKRVKTGVDPAPQ